MSQLNVNKITGTTGTTSGAPITLSGDTATLGSGVTNNAGVASGTIGSAVTGTLGSGVTFPAGHILQTKHYTSTVSNGTSTDSATSATAGISLGYVHITPLKANSLIWITAHYSYNFSRVANYQCVLWWVGFKIGTGNQAGTFSEFTKYFQDYDGAREYATNSDIYRHPTLSVIHDPSYSLGQTISYEWKIGAGRGSGSVAYPTVYTRDDSENPPSWIGVQEIAQ
jgi:hypothetical protein